VAESIFDELTEDDRREVMRRARRTSFKAREVVFHEADLGDTVHLIESGLVAIRRTTALGDVVTYAVLGAGDTFGELALILPDSERSASVVALLPTRTLALHRQDFEELRTTHPSVDRILLVALACTVRRLSARVLDAHYVGADTRVVRNVVELANAFGGLEPGTVIPFTQDDLAGLAGTTRQTVNKVLRECEDAGMLTLSRGRVTIVDGALLAKRAR
jgi:CRP/FNR family cyclic AMP-dependent transcriptional regulator